ncbi:MAG: hypothetical protein M0Z73_02565 [Betaproteobacteria bacterium]|nr:hypothetical protein [Betaproteobacteria bacterium]
MDRPLYWPLRRPPEATFEGIHVALGGDWAKYADATPEGFAPIGVVRLPEKKRAALFVQGDRFVTARRGDVVEMTGLDALFTRLAIRKAVEKAESYAEGCRWKKTKAMTGLANEARLIERNQKRLQAEAPPIYAEQFDRARELSRKFPTPSRTAELAAIIAEMNISTLLMFLGHIGLFGERMETAVSDRLIAIRNELLASIDKGEQQ